eukprot:XP_001698544.1 predicted protein [Chlamydomonas reinhardtii]
MTPKRVQAASSSALALALLACACACAFGAKSPQDCPEYEILQTRDDVELRRYKKAHWISTNVTGAKWGDAYDEGYQRLQDYVKGGNADGRKLPQTNPSFTLVYVSDPRAHALSSTFTIEYFVPFELQLAVTPVEQQDVWVLSFGGFATEDVVVTRGFEFLANLTGDGLDVATEYFGVALYDQDSADGGSGPGFEDGPTDAAVGCFDSFSAVHNYQEPSLNQAYNSSRVRNGLTMQRSPRSTTSVSPATYSLPVHCISHAIAMSGAALSLAVCPTCLTRLPVFPGCGLGLQGPGTRGQTLSHSTLACPAHSTMWELEPGVSPVPVCALNLYQKPLVTEVLREATLPGQQARVTPLHAEKPTCVQLQAFLEWRGIADIHPAPLWSAVKGKRTAAQRDGVGTDGDGASAAGGPPVHDLETELKLFSAVTASERQKATALLAAAGERPTELMLEPDQTYHVLHTIPRSATASQDSIMLRLHRQLASPSELLSAPDVQLRMMNASIIIGGVSPMHLGPIRAFNMALAPSCLGGEAANTVLARWVFVSPAALGTALQLVYDLLQTAETASGVTHFVHLFHIQATGQNRPYFTDEGVAWLIEQGGLVVGRDILVLDQRHGDVVTVPPGWAHQVTNLKTCIKLAFDHHDLLEVAAHYELLHLVRQTDAGLQADAAVTATAMLLADTPQVEQTMLDALRTLEHD